MTRTAPIRLSLKLANAPDGPYPTIDYFPHRVTLRRDYTHQDVLVHMAMVGLRFSRGTQYIFTNRALDEIVTQGLDAPFAALKPGAIVSSDDPELDADIVITHDGRDTRVENGLQIPSEMLRNKNLFDAMAQKRRDAGGGSGTTLEWIQESYPQLHVKLGLVALALPAPLTEQETRSRICAIAARIARLLDIGYGSGADASARAAKDIGYLWDSLRTDWLIEPDHFCFGTKLIATDDLEAAFKAIPEDISALCGAAWAATQDVPVEDLEDASTAKKGAKIADSNHQSLRLHEALRRLDRAIETSSPLNLLKPAAFKRQSKLRG